MSEQDFKDPPRLLDSLEGGGDLKAMLAAGKSETPDDARMLVLAAKIGIAGGLGGAGAAGAAGAGGAAGASAGAGAGAGAKVAAGAASAVKIGLAAKIVGAVAIAGAVGGGAVAVHRAANTASSATPPAGMIAQPSATTTARPTSVPANPAPTDTSLAIADPFASAAPSAATSARTVKSAAPSASAEDNSPSAELALLEKAQDALRSRPAEALTLTNEHARRFPKGSYAQEREVIAIEALAKTGRTAEARARADRFKRAFPGSASIRRIDAILGD